MIDKKLSEKAKDLQDQVGEIQAVWRDAEQQVRKGMKRDAIYDLYELLDSTLEKFYGYDEAEYIEGSEELYLHRYEDYAEKIIWTENQDYPMPIPSTAYVVFKIDRQGKLDMWKEYLDQDGDVVHEYDPYEELKDHGVEDYHLEAIASKLRIIRTWS